MYKGGISIIGALIFGFIVIVILSYFHISIRAVVEDPGTQDNLHYVGGGTISLWQKYLKVPATYLWDKIIIPLFWNVFVSNMQQLRDGQGSDFQNNAPTLNFGSTP